MSRQLRVGDLEREPQRLNAQDSFEGYALTMRRNIYKLFIVETSTKLGVRESARIREEGRSGPKVKKVMTNTIERI